MILVIQTCAPVPAEAAGGDEVGTVATVPRALGNAAWSQTDWSAPWNGSATDIVTHVPGEITIAPNGTSYVVLFSDSSMANAYDMETYRGDLFIATTNYPDPSDDMANVWVLDSGQNTVSLNRNFPDTGIVEMSVSQGKLIVPGLDSDRTAGNGKLFYFDGTDWVTKVTVPNGLEVYDAVYFNDVLYADATTSDGTQTAGRGDLKVFRSDTNGDTWVQNLAMTASVGNPRAAYDMFIDGPRLYMQTDGRAGEGPVIRMTNFTAWSSEATEDVADAAGKFVMFNGDAYLLNGNNLYMRIDAGATKRWQLVETPLQTMPFAAEEFNASAGSWSDTSSDMKVPRFGLEGVRLGNDNVLVSGGVFGGTISNKAESYEPSSGNWTATGSMNARRVHHTLTVLGDGRVLAVGGFSGHKGSARGAVNSVETYNAGAWTSVSNMVNARALHTATLLDNGNVLACGGSQGGFNDIMSGTPTDTCDIFDPATNLWSPGPSMNEPRFGHTATKMANGTVLVTGGITTGGVPTDTVELYGSGSWHVFQAIPGAAAFHTAVLDAGDNVILAGGIDAGMTVSSASFEFDSSIDTWSTQGAMSSVRAHHTSLLVNGQIMVIGGMDAAGEPLTGCEVYSGGTWSAAGALGIGRKNATSALLTGGNVLVAGGHDISGVISGIDHLPYRETATRAIASDADHLHIAAGLSDGSGDIAVYSMDRDGTWTRMGGPAGGNIAAGGMASHHGRLFIGAETVSGAKVYVQESKPYGTLESEPIEIANNLYMLNGTINWNGSVPAGTSISFKLRSGRNLTELNASTFVGPDGTAATSYTTSGEIIAADHAGARYLQYQATLATTVVNATPVIEDVLLDMWASGLLLERIDITPGNVTITADGTQQFTAGGSDQFGMPYVYPFTWTTTGGAINETGYYWPNKAGTFEVYATGLGVKGTANITVEPGVLKTIDVVQTGDDPQAPPIILKAGNYKVFEAVGKDAKGNELPFTPSWSVSGPGELTTLSGGRFGNYSAVIPANQVKVFANATNALSEKLSGNISIKVFAGDLASLVITPSTASITADDSIVLKARGFDALSNPVSFYPSWDVPPGIGQFETSGDDLNISANSVGEWTIWANASGGQSTSATITVTAGKLAGITIDPEDVLMNAGETVNFTVAGVDADGNPVVFSPAWSVNNNGSMTGNSFTPTRTGTYTVQVSGAGKTASTTVRVSPGELDHAVITPRNLEILAYDSEAFSVKVYDAFNNEITGALITWGTVGGIGSIGSSGVFTAENVTAQGTVVATITFRSKTISVTATVSTTAIKAPNDNEWRMPDYYVVNAILIMAMLMLGALLVITELVKIKVRRVPTRQYVRPDLSKPEEKPRPVIGEEPDGPGPSPGKEPPKAGGPIS